MKTANPDFGHQRRQRDRRHEEQPQPERFEWRPGERVDGPLRRMRAGGHVWPIEAKDDGRSADRRCILMTMSHYTGAGSRRLRGVRGAGGSEAIRLWRRPIRISRTSTAARVRADAQYRVLVEFARRKCSTASPLGTRLVPLRQCEVRLTIGTALSN